MSHRFPGDSARVAWQSRVIGLGLALALAFALAAPVALASDAEPNAEPDTEPRIDLLVREIEAGLERRGQTEVFEQYVAWTADRLDASAGDRTWDDKTGNCRLSWVDRMLREPLWAIGEAERFTRDLHVAARRDDLGLDEIMATAAHRLDLPQRDALDVSPPPASPEAAIDAIREGLVNAHAALDQALEPLSDNERRELEEHLYPVSTGDIVVGHRFADREIGRRVCDLIEKLDREALHRAAEAVIPLAAPDLLDQLARYEPGQDAGQGADDIDGIDGKVHRRIPTPVGDIVIGARHDNTYDLEQMHDVAAVIDLGGDNTYLEGTVGPHRPALVLIDLDGDDTYRGEKPGIQGGAILGVSLLVNRAGDNTYEAQDVAQGACLVGAGILVDYAGGNTYLGDRRVQGSAIGGVGLLMDRAGDDRYRAALLGQGVGGPLGFGMLVDLTGDDEFYGGGKYDNAYGDSAGFEGWSQGVGVGPRGVANGGIGVLLAGAGDNLYECDYFSHGGGYWFAAGFARDFAGNDRRIGATRTMHDGSEREVRRFLRWGIGWQAHYGLGFVFDDEGDDFYRADAAGPAFSWDIGLAALIDFAGDDHYVNPRAEGAEAGFAVLYDYAGDDTYDGGRQGHARERVTYHPMPDAGGNFGFLIDYGGDDLFIDTDLGNNRYEQRGSAGGFFISRPAPPTADELGRDPDREPVE